MTLALLTRGYICPPLAVTPPDVVVGEGPTIVEARELAPKIDHGRELSPQIIRGEEEDPCP